MVQIESYKLKLNKNVNEYFCWHLILCLMHGGKHTNKCQQKYSFTLLLYKYIGLNVKCKNIN